MRSSSRLRSIGSGSSFEIWFGKKKWAAPSPFLLPITKHHSRKSIGFEGVSEPPPPTDGIPRGRRPKARAGVTLRDCGPAAAAGRATLAAAPRTRLEDLPMSDPLLIAKHGNVECALLPALVNRHGLITGATGTGKTVTLQVLAERLSAHRRAGLHGRREGRPCGPEPAGQDFAEVRGAAQARRRRRTGLRGMPDDVLGPLRRTGASGSGDRVGHGSAAARDASSISTRRRKAC